MVNIRTIDELLGNVPHRSEPSPAQESSKSSAPDTLPVAPVVQTIEEGEFTPKVKMSSTAKAAPVEPLTKPMLSRDYIRYPLIFVVAFGFFYFFLNFGAFTSQISARFHREAPVAQNDQGKVLGVSTPDYEAWIGGYFYQANSTEALSPNVDYDKDGMTNYQEFLLGTNPTKKDTDNDGYSDGQEILNGYSPLGEGLLTADEQNIIKDWDLRDISDRISFNTQLALSSSDPYENPLAGLSAGPQTVSNSLGINYDLNNPGELNIPKLNVKAPIVWSQSPDNFVKDLESGPIHYPGTAFPGQVGVSYISGHSSNYVWSKSKYSYVFTRINELNVGDEFFVTVPKADGQKVSLRYVVSEKKEYKPDDQGQFETGAFGQSVVNLSTCWPVGSTARRYVVSGTLAGV